MSRKRLEVPASEFYYGEHGAAPLWHRPVGVELENARLNRSAVWKLSATTDLLESTTNGVVAENDHPQAGTLPEHGG